MSPRVLTVVAIALLAGVLMLTIRSVVRSQDVDPKPVAATTPTDSPREPDRKTGRRVVRIPERLDTQRSAGLESRPEVPRYAETTSRDELERITQNILIVFVNQRDNIIFQASEVDDHDLTAFAIWYVARQPKREEPVLPQYCAASDFELVSRLDGIRQGIRAFKSMTEDVPHEPLVNRSVAFNMEAEELLNVVDSGAMRVSREALKIDIALDEQDQEAVRWFLWNRAPRVRDLMRSRYDIVEAKK